MRDFISKYDGPEIERRLDRLGAIMPFATLTKKAPYLYETRYGKFDYAKAKAYFETKAPVVTPSGCTAVSKGSFVGRNLDWLYNHQADIVVHSPELDGQYASVSMCSETGLDASLVASGAYDEKWDLLPFFAQDGVNRFGVYANINVVPLDHEPTTATVPAVAKRDRICALMLVRYILDTFTSAREAVNYIANYVEVYFPTTLQAMGYESHWMVKDRTATFIVEIVNNAVVVMENRHVLSNFYVHGVDFKPDGTVYTNADVADGYLPSDYGITPHGSGLERHNLAVAARPLVSDKVGMRFLMNNLLFTKAYKNTTEPFWYSEYTGDGASGNVTVDTPSESALMDTRLALVQGWYESRERGDSLTWQTTHSCVYDLENLKVCVVAQEDVTSEYVFGIPMFYTADEIDAILENVDALPPQEDNAGKVLTTDGENASWEDPNKLVGLRFPIPSPQSPFVVQHNLGRIPSVSVVDSVGNEVLADIDHTDGNSFTVSWNGPLNGNVIVI